VLRWEILSLARSEGVLFYSIRPSAGPATPLTGAAIEDDLPVQTGDEELLGQIDGVESGEVTGWACHRGYMAKPLEVRVPLLLYTCCAERDWMILLHVSRVLSNTVLTAPTFLLHINHAEHAPIPILLDFRMTMRWND